MTQTAPAWLWIIFTLTAATAQTLRNAALKKLTEQLGALGATHVRFRYGLPFGLLSLVVVGLAWGELPVPDRAVTALDRDRSDHADHHHGPDAGGNAGNARSSSRCHTPRPNRFKPS